MLFAQCFESREGGSQGLFSLVCSVYKVSEMAHTAEKNPKWF